MTWRIAASPVMGVVAVASALYQMLNPRVMWMIDQASSFKTNPALRGELTGEYTFTITFGDTEQAEKAGAALRYIHSLMKAKNPQTGDEYTPNEPELLMWVHCTLTWVALQAADRWGPALSPAEHDQYVKEQQTAARLVGLDPSTVPATRAGLEAYLQGMRPWLAFVIEAQWFRDMMVPTGLIPDLKSLVMRWVQQAAVGLLPADARELYGFHYTPWHERWVNA
ncbi:MAG: oxygenase MpaB family protein, partial [bacterium]